MRPKLRTVLSLALLSMVVVGGRPEPVGAEPDLETIRLARIGTIGDLPAKGTRVIVNVTAEGKIVVKGRPLKLSALRDYLMPLADLDREDDQAKASRLHAVLRIDRAALWREAVWIMQTCADPSVRIYRIHFAVLPEEGDEEGAIAAWLPKDRGLRRTPVNLEERLRITVTLTSKGPAVEPAALYFRARQTVERLRKEIDGPVVFRLRADLEVPVGYVLRVMDVLHRAGVDGITFTGAPPPRPGAGSADPGAGAGGASAGPGIRFLDEKLTPPAGGYPELPPVERVRGGFAGAAGAGRGVVMVEVARPIEQDDEPIEEPVEDVPTDAPFAGPDPKARIGGGAGGAFGGRGGHRNLVARGGGSKKTEDAVNLGLEWLKDHQDPGGFWDCDGFMKMDKVTPITDGGGNAMYDPGVSGLALLAFLGAGETHKHGRYRKTVREGLEYLKQIQDPEGCFGHRTTSHFTYNHGVAALAMVEAYGLTHSPLFKLSAQQGIDFIHKCRNPYLAWRYGVRPQDNDTSVSGWMLMALKSAKVAGLRVDPAAFEGMMAWLDKVTEPEWGRAGYVSRGTGPARPQDLLDRFPPDKSESLTAVGILSRVFLGEDPRKSEVIAKGTELCLKALPNWDPRDGSIDMYYWYYGSLALFQVGGEPWKRWNIAMKSAIVPHQRMDGAYRGSWDPIGPWGREGGRVYSTALMVMCMEVYYRCARVFGVRGR